VFSILTIIIIINIMIEFLKSSWKNYKQPTPVQYRKAGDIILIVSSALGLILPLIYPTVPLYLTNGILILGIIGKFLSSFKTAQTPKEIIELINTIKSSMKEAEN